MPTDMTVSEAIRQTMDCAKGIVQSYGGRMRQVDRDNLCRAMEHYATVALMSLTPEKSKPPKKPQLTVVRDRP